MGDSYGMEGSPGDVSPFLNILSFTLGWVTRRCEFWR
jgi:hypothetical protein